MLYLSTLLEITLYVLSIITCDNHEIPGNKAWSSLYLSRSSGNEPSCLPFPDVFACRTPKNSEPATMSILDNYEFLCCLAMLKQRNKQTKNSAKTRRVVAELPGRGFQKQFPDFILYFYFLPAWINSGNDTCVILECPMSFLEGRPRLCYIAINGNES